MVEPKRRRVPESRLAWWLEKAGCYQTSALAALREARDPRRPVSPTRHRELLLRAWRQLVLARGLLERARRAVDAGPMAERLDGHLARLADTLGRVERVFEQTEERLAEG